MTQETSNETTEEIPGCVLLMLALFDIAGLFSKFPEEPPRPKESVGKPGPTYQDFEDEYRKAEELLKQNRLEDAEKTARKILKWAEGPLASRPLALADAAQMLATVLYQQGRLAEAQSAWHTALTAREKVLPPNHPELAHNFNSLGIVYQELGRYREGEEALREAITRAESHGLALEVLARAYRGLGEIAWATGRPQEALTHLQKALEHIEWLRPQASTEELHRAGFFEQWKYRYELMVTWQSELGQVQEVLWAMEMSRARTLLEQLATAGVDLLAGLPPQEAAPCKRPSPTPPRTWQASRGSATSSGSAKTSPRKNAPPSGKNLPTRSSLLSTTTFRPEANFGQQVLPTAWPWAPSRNRSLCTSSRSGPQSMRPWSWSTSWDGTSPSSLSSPATSPLRC